MKKSLKVIFSVVIVAVLIIAGTYSTEKFIANDASVATGDSVVSGWVYIGGSPNVALNYSVEDTMNVYFTARYRFGQEPHNVVAVDTVGTTGTTLTGKSKGRVLRGYGLATDLIPGANWIYVHCNAVTGQTNSAVKVGLMMAD